MKLIDKGAFQKKIEERYECWREKEHNSHSVESEIRMSECQHILLLLNFLEVKEVDLEGEINNHIKECLDIKFPTTDIELIKKDVEYTSRKFFELGLKAQKGE